MKKQLFTLLTLLVMCVTGAWADVTYYTPEADEVIILTNVYDKDASTANYSKHAGVLFYANNASFSSKTVGDPDDNTKTLSGNSLLVKNNGDVKRVTLNITGVKKITVYHESHSSRYVRLLDLNNSNTVLKAGSASTYYTELELTGTTNYSIRLEGYDGNGQTDLGVYAVKIEKYGASKTPSDLTLTSSATLLLSKTETSTITHTTSSSGAITYTSADEDVATVTSGGVITAVGGGTAKITVSQASDETYAAGSKVVTVNVPYDNPAAAGTYTLTHSEHAFSNDAQTTHYFKNGFTITTNDEDGMQYAAIENNNGIKYSHVRTYTINTPSNVTATYLEIKARNNYATGGTAANWGTVLGTNYSDQELPFSDEEPQTKYFKITNPTAGADLVFSPDGNQWQGYITVHTNAWVDATGVELKNATSLEVGDKETLIAAFTPTDASNKFVTWTSSDETVATVANGVVTAVAAGTANITATTEDGGYDATCEVTVTEPVINKTLPYSEDFTSWSNVTFSQGNTETSDVKKGITFYSKHDSKQFSVDSNGLTFPDNNISTSNYFFAIQLTGVANQTIKVTVTPKTYSGKKASVKYVIADGETTVSTPGNSTTQAQAEENGGNIAFTATCAKKDAILYIGRYNGDDYNKTITNISIETVAVSATIASSGYSSLGSKYGLDFSNVTTSTEGAVTLTAFAATKSSEESVKLVSINEAPAETGVILKGTPGATYTIPVKANAAELTVTNLLHAAVTATDIEANTSYIMQGGKFHLVTEDSTVPEGKAYLVPATTPARELSFVFDGQETTGINVVTDKKTATGVYYNLAGQRVNQPVKGIYVVDGKKVIK